MPLGTEVGLGPGDILLDGDPAPPAAQQPPLFGPCLLWRNGRPSQNQCCVLVAQLNAELPYTSQWAALSHVKIAPSHGISGYPSNT